MAGSATDRSLVGTRRVLQLDPRGRERAGSCEIVEVMAVPIVRVTSDRLPRVVSMSARAFVDEAMFR